MSKLYYCSKAKWQQILENRLYVILTVGQTHVSEISIDKHRAWREYMHRNAYIWQRVT